MGAALLDDALFRQVAEALPLLVWTADATGYCDYACSRLAQYTGADREGLLGVRWLELIHPEDRERTHRSWRRALAQSATFGEEVRIRRYDGAYRWFETRASALRDGEGRVQKWLGLCLDVHEARALRDTLEREQDRLKRIVATAPGAFFSVRRAPDGSLTVPEAAPAFAELSGISPDMLEHDAGAGFARIHPDDLLSLLTAIAESGRTLTPWRGEYRYLHPTKGELWIEGHAIPAAEPDGSVRWYGFVRDFSERRRAEESLRKTQAQLVAALEAGGMGIFLWEVPEDRLWMDEPLLRLLGRVREETTGRPSDVVEFTHPDDRERVREALATLAREGADQHFDCRIVRRDGALRWLSVRASCERDDAGRVARVTALHVDVTLQKQAAEAQLRSQKLEALGTLAGGIAHDFNNILQAILGNTSLALRSLGPGHPARAFLDGVGTATARASDLVRRILAFSHSEEQRASAIPLATAVGEALKLVRATLPAQIEITMSQADDALSVVAEPAQIHQIVVNLATNAAHAIGSSTGRIDLTLVREVLGGRRRGRGPDLPDGRYAVLHVADSGCGISPDTLERIFDPFFTTKPVGQGTGLGLSVVHGIMHSLGGAVTVYSEVGQGTTFSLYFPLAATPVEPPVRTDAGPPKAHGERILFVDDEDMLVVLGVHILESLGYIAIGHSEPVDALRAFTATPDAFDAVITDVSMPGMSGFELAERLHALRPELPILMMSGYVGSEEMEIASRLGVRDLLLKPVSIEELGRALGKLLPRQSESVLQKT